MTFSPHKLAGRKCGVCSISEQNENEMRSANATRRDQRTFRCGVTRARRGRKKEKRSRVSFRQRHGGGRCAPASFQPSLRSASLFRSPNRRPKRNYGNFASRQINFKK
jgi:hypothetical protein